MRARTAVRRGGLLAVALTAAACIASNVVAPQQRLVVDDLAALEWAPAPELPLLGLYESVDIRGEAAATLRKVYYRFAADGTYTAAALTEVDGRCSFQTLDGTWRADVDGLSLDGAPPVPLERAPGHVRLRAPNGELVLAQRPGV
ncbi:MAG: hypothetical protein H6835_13435 [Planctomycetes bacterium]|nr:hypothetical protein [Planctomycetota bacterium]